MIRIAMLFALASLTIPGLAFASSADLATIESECGPQLKMSPAACACIKSKAAALSDNQQAFVAAVVSKDKAKQTAVMQNMTVGEMTMAGTFMTTAPAECGKVQ